MQPSILENIQENYNYQTIGQDDEKYDNEQQLQQQQQQYKYEKDYQDNYGEYDVNKTTTPHFLSSSDIQQEYTTDNTHIVNHMRPTYHHNMPQDPHMTQYLSSIKRDSPYLSREHITHDLYSPRSENHYTMKNSNSNRFYSEQIHPQQQQHPRGVDYHSDRMSEGSDKNGYLFPYTAEEDHTTNNISHIGRLHSTINDINNPPGLPSSRLSSRHGSRTSSPSIMPIPSMQPLAPLTNITDTSE